MPQARTTLEPDKPIHRNLTGSFWRDSKKRHLQHRKNTRKKSPQYQWLFRQRRRSKRENFFREEYNTPCRKKQGSILQRQTGSIHGKYYLCTISVQMGSDGNAVYNIGKIQERSLPEIKGSSAKCGAQSGKTSFEKSIIPHAEKSKGKFSKGKPAAYSARTDTTFYSPVEQMVQDRNQYEALQAEIWRS